MKTPPYPLLDAAARDLWRNVRPKLFVRSLAADAIRLALLRGPASTALAVSDVLLQRMVPAVVPRERLALLFPEMPGRDLARLEREIRSQIARSRLAYWYVKYGQWPRLRAVVGTSGFERLARRPAILLTWHLGGYSVLGKVLEAEGHDNLVMSALEEARGEAGFVANQSLLEERTAVAARALSRLRQGGIVVIAGDGGVGDTGFPVPVLGHRPVLRPGAVALARLTGAPVLPTTATWRGERLEVRVHAPLSLPPADSREVFLERAAHAMGAWLDGHLREFPEGLTPYHVDRLLEGPKAR